MIIFCSDNEIQEVDLPIEIKESGAAVLPKGENNWNISQPFKEAKDIVIADFEKEYISKLLVHHKWNITEAAEAGGVNRKTFQRLIAKHGLS